MAQYAFLYRGGTPMPESPTEMQQRMGRWLAWFEELTRQGHLKDRGLPLERTGKTAGARKHVTDGPYAEKDLVIGFTLVEARDLDHATELSLGCPIFEQGGVVEVRPVLNR